MRISKNIRKILPSILIIFILLSGDFLFAETKKAGQKITFALFTSDPGNLLLVVDSALNIDKLMSILERINQPPTHKEPPAVNVFPLENANVTELSKDSSHLSRITDEKDGEFTMPEKQYIEGELLVKFNEGVSNEEALDIILKQGASVITFIETINAYHIRLRPGQEVEDAIKEFSSIPEIQYAEPNYKIKIQK